MIRDRGTQVGGRTIVRYPAILRLIKDELPRYLFSLVFSLEPRNSLVSVRPMRIRLSELVRSC